MLRAEQHLSKDKAYLGLAPKGVYITIFVTKNVVGFYPTFSPLPKKNIGGLFSVALSLGFPPPDVIRLWCSDESGLSSLKRQPHNHLVLIFKEFLHV